MWFKNGKYYTENDLKRTMEILQFYGDVKAFARGFGIVYCEPSDRLIEDLILSGDEYRAVYIYRKLYNTTVREAHDAIKERINNV